MRTRLLALPLLTAAASLCAPALASDQPINDSKPYRLHITGTADEYIELEIGLSLGSQVGGKGCNEYILGLGEYKPATEYKKRYIKIESGIISDSILLRGVEKVYSRCQWRLSRAELRILDSRGSENALATLPLLSYDRKLETYKISKGGEINCEYRKSRYGNNPRLMCEYIEHTYRNLWNLIRVVQNEYDYKVNFKINLDTSFTPRTRWELIKEHTIKLFDILTGQSWKK